MWDDLTIGENHGNTADGTYVSGISQNKRSFWITRTDYNSYLVEAMIAKDTPQGEEIQKIFDEYEHKDEEHAEAVRLIGYVLLRYTAEHKSSLIYRRIREAEDEAYAAGIEQNQATIRSALGLKE